MATAILAKIVATTALWAVIWLPVRELGQIASHGHAGNKSHSLNARGHSDTTAWLEESKIVCAQNACWNAPAHHQTIKTNQADQHSPNEVDFPALGRPPLEPEDIFLNQQLSSLKASLWSHVDYDHLRKTPRRFQISNSRRKRAINHLRTFVAAIIHTPGFNLLTPHGYTHSICAIRTKECLEDCHIHAAYSTGFCS